MNDVVDGRDPKPACGAACASRLPPPVWAFPAPLGVAGSGGDSRVVSVLTG